MSDVFRLISEYFWLVALAFSAFNYWKASKDITRVVDPERVPQARAYLQKFAIAAALPWVVMGAGQLSGTTPTVWHYFRPHDGNAFVLAWFAVILVLSCAFAWWVLLAGGAKKTVEFNLLAAMGQHHGKPPSENMIKLFAVLGVLMLPIWVYMAVSMNVPLPG